MRKLLLVLFLVSFLTYSAVAQTVTTISAIQDTTGTGSSDSPFKDQIVTVEGVVSGESWAFGSTYYIQDGSGPWSGVMVYDSNHPNAYGDSIRITGLVVEYYGVTEIKNITEYTKLDSGKTVIPTVVTTGEIGTGGINSEAYEGVLVQVKNVAITNPDLGYGEWEVDDGSGGCRVDDAADYYFTQANYDSVRSITGVLAYNYNNTKILPRLAYDVVEAGEHTRIQRVQQVRISDLLTAPYNEFADRSYLDGETIKLKGIVTFPSDLSNAGAGIAFHFGEPEGGPWSEILSYNADSTAYPVLFEGDEIEMEGYAAEYHPGSAGGFTEFFMTGPINIIDFGKDLPPVDTLATGDLRVPQTAEQWEIVKVAVKDAVIKNVNIEYYLCTVDDGTGEVTISGAGSNIMGDYVVPPPGTMYKSIRGWVVNTYGSYADSTTYQLAPVYPEDLVIGSGPPQIMNAFRDPCVPTSSDPVVISVDVTSNATIESVTINYAVNSGPYSTAEMSLSAGDTWTGTIPIQSDDSWVDYYIVATDNFGLTSSMPADTSVMLFSYVIRDAGLQISDIQYTPWSIGDSPFNGCDVTITGIVTADTAANNNYGAYAIQDAEGAWNGLFVFGIDANLDRGDEITVSGTVADYNADWHFKWDNNTLILANSFNVVSTGNAIDAVAVTTGDLNGDGAEVESYEGTLVKIENATLMSINSYDATFDDGSGTCLVDDDLISAGFFINSGEGYLYAFGDTLRPGDKVDMIQGVFTYSFGSYKIEVRDVYDYGSSVGVDPNFVRIPLSYKLDQNFPNPFNPETRIYFEIPEVHKVKVIIYNMLGQKVRTLINEGFNAGYHIINWDGCDDSGYIVPSGIYIYRLKAGDFIASKKMMMMK